MNKLTIRKTNLPSTIPELNKFILIGKEQLKMYQSKIKVIDKLNLASAVRNQAVEDGQRMGTALLYAEAKLGELLKDIKPQSSQQGRLRQLPEGITHKQSHYAQQLAENMDIVEEVIEESIDFEDIPTKSAVLKKINEKKSDTVVKEKEINILETNNKCPKCGYEW